jgi:hypothetical protein
MLAAYTDLYDELLQPRSRTAGSLIENKEQ